MSKHFWRFGVINEAQRSLQIDGAIAEESWYDDDVTPREFREGLDAGAGDIVLWINSPGGDVFAASQIYTMLRDYPGKVTVKIDGIAASAASVVAMAGDEVLMSPTAMMMIHNPMTVAFGDSAEMQRAIDMLAEVKESIINAYERKTGMQRAKISRLMDAETWMNARKAVELSFADGYIEDPSDRREPDAEAEFYEAMAARNSLMQKAIAKARSIPEPVPEPEPANIEKRRTIDELMAELNHKKYR